MNRPFARWIVFSMAFAGTCPMAAEAGLLNIERKLTASDAAKDDQFGRSVAIDGETVVVGAPQWLYEGSPRPGVAYVINATTREEVRKLTAFDGAANDAFGSSVGLSHNIAIVGAVASSHAGRNSGAAYLFNVGDGSERFKLTASDAAADDLFGFSASINGSRAIVGAMGNDSAGIDAGSAYTYDVESGAELFKLTAADAEAGDKFGVGVAISEGRLIVGADGNNSRRGAAYVFDADTGSELRKLVASDGWIDEHFGYSVAIEGNLAIVGAPHHQNSVGAAYVFDVTTGEELFKLTASDRSAREYFGGAVALSGNLAIVGASGNQRDRGAAYVYDLTSGLELLTLTADDAAEEDRLGEFVDIDGFRAIVSSRLDDDGGNFSGSAYLFVPEPSSWLLAALAGGLAMVRRGGGVGRVIELNRKR